MDSWSVRRAGDGDVSALVRVRHQSAVEQVGQIIDDRFEHDWRDWYGRERDRRVFWLAEIAEGAIGATNLMIFDRMPRPGGGAGRWGYLANMYVVAEHRNRGVGHDLLAAVLDHARQLHLVRVVLSPSARSRPFYERAGFAPASELFVLTLDDRE
ncbi:MAG: acetyltransferase [Acidimicrobiales bacterium]|nr:acetyltransferase [Acidimicrobiales bacterium]